MYKTEEITGLERYQTPEAPRPGRLQLKTKVTIRKWESDEAKERGDDPFEVRESEGNVGLNTGIQNLLDYLCSLGGVPQAYDSTGSFLFVGENSTAATATQIGLLGVTSATGTLMGAMDSTSYPARAAQTVSWRSTYAAADANFHWVEFTVDVPAATSDASSTVNSLVRKVEDEGTKVAGQSWELTLAIAMS